MAWAAESGGNQVTGLIFLVVLGSPQVFNTPVLVSICCRPTVDERVGWVYGNAGLLVFAHREKCDDLGAPVCPAGMQPTVVSQTVLRLTRPPAQPPFTQLATLNDVLEPLSVDSGRVVLRHANGALEVRNSAGALVRQFPALAGVSRGAELMGKRLIVLVPGKILDLSVANGQQLHARPVANVASGGVCGVLRCPTVALKLLDAKRGLVAYLRAGKLRLLRLSDGVNRVVAAAVDARFGDNGLFYAYTTSGAWPSRVRFVPWASLPVRP